MEVSGQPHAMATLPLRKETPNLHETKIIELKYETFSIPEFIGGHCKIKRGIHVTDCKMVAFEDCMNNHLYQGR
jgi:hypothetical protein